jgi:hypothetical protein
MTQSMNSCFYDKCLPKIEEFLEQLENENDETILAWYEDKEELCEKLAEKFNTEDDIYYGEEDCFATINFKLKYFQEMIKFIQVFDEDYTYDGDVVKMFKLYTYRFMRDSLRLDGTEINDDDIMDLIQERLEELCDKINPVETQPPSDDESETDEDEQIALIIAQAREVIAQAHIDSDEESDEDIEEESDEDIEVPFNTDLMAQEILEIEDELPPQQ